MADTSLLAVLAVAGVAALALGAAAYAGGMGFMGAPMAGGMGGHGGMMGGGHGQGGMPGQMGQGGMGQPGAPMAGGMMGQGGHEGPMAGEAGEGHGECPCEEMMGGGMMGGMMGQPGHEGRGWMDMDMAVFYNGTASVAWVDPVMGLVGLQLEDGTSVTAKLARAYVRAGDGALVYGGWIAGALQQAGEAYVVLAGNEYRALVVELDVAGNAYLHPMALAFQVGPGPGH